jgi:hypothetical protein
MHVAMAAEHKTLAPDKLAETGLLVERLNPTAASTCRTQQERTAEASAKAVTAVRFSKFRNIATGSATARKPAQRPALIETRSRSRAVATRSTFSSDPCFASERRPYHSEIQPARMDQYTTCNAVR